MKAYNVYTMCDKDNGYKVELIGESLPPENATTVKNELVKLGLTASIYAIDPTLTPEDFHSRVVNAMQPLEFSHPIVIMQDGTTSVYSYYKTPEAAQAKLAELASDRDSYSITTWADYDERQKAAFLGACEEVTESYYRELLDCLPPKRFGINEGVDSFFMSEFSSGSYTSQLAKHGGKYYAKAVDYYDKSTWIKTSEFENAPFNERSKEWGI